MLQKARVKSSMIIYRPKTELLRMGDGRECRTEQKKQVYYYYYYNIIIIIIIWYSCFGIFADEFSGFGFKLFHRDPAETIR